MDVIELKLSDDEFRKIRYIVHKTTGIFLAENKRALVISRLFRRLRELNLTTFQPYIHLLETDSHETIGFINRITTNLTRFYREKNQFDILKQKVLPLVMEHKHHIHDKNLRIWSAGCSTGEEVYTILFEIMDSFNGHVPTGWDFKILGSDIDTTVLKKAYAAQYTIEEIKGVKQDTLQKYFIRVSDTLFQVKEVFRRFVGFRRINLVYDEFNFKRKIDVIFCRNVVIYFDKETRANVYRKFHAALNNPGYFFSGHSENLFKFGHVFKFVEKSVYKKVV